MKTIKTYEHNANTWGITIDDYNQKSTLLWGNTEGEFYNSLPENIKIKNNIGEKPITDTTDANYDGSKVTAFNEGVLKLFNSKVQEIIDGILRNKGVRINSHINFDWLLEFTKIELRKAVYHTIQDSIRNHWAEMHAQSSFNTNQLSINNDLTNWIISAQQRKTAAWNALSNSGIDKYKVVGDNFAGMYVNESAKGIINLYEWNDVELGKSLGEYATLEAGISVITDIDKYDYIIVDASTGVTDKQLFRFEGGDHKLKTNWESKTTSEVQGMRYFIYENIILVGETGKDGKPGADGKSFNLKGNLDTFDDIKATAAELDDAWIAKDTGIIWLFNGKTWIDMGHMSIASQKQQFREVNKEGVTVLEPFSGQPIILETVDGKGIFSDNPNAAAKRHEISDVTQANNWKKMPTINKRINIKNPTDPGGPFGSLEHFGDLDTQDARKNFMDNVSVGSWYTFLIDTKPYLAVITSGDKTTNYLWTGYRIITGATGKTVEIVNGSTSLTGHGETVSSFTGDAFSSSLNIPSGYSVLQYMPKDAIVQLITDMIAPTITDQTDPTWQDIPGTQSTLFNPSQITITLTNSQITAGENVQLILGSSAGNLVLNESVKVYGDVVTASQNGYVAGQYKWYMFVDGTNIKFVMEDSAGALTDTSQAITKIRRVTPRVQPFTGHYTSQADILQNSTWIGELTTGASKIVTLPGPITIDTMAQLGLSVSGTTDWADTRGWDKVTPFYTSVMTEDTSNTWWVEYKIEAVPGDKTKIKVTNFDSGNQSSKGQAYKAHWLHTKGGL